MPDLDLSAEPPTPPKSDFDVLDYSNVPSGLPPPPPSTSEPYNPERTRETARGDLARGLLLLLTLTIGGVLAFIGLGRLDGTVLTQSIFPSLVALAGTALGFYFGSQTAKESARGPDSSPGPSPAPVPAAPAGANAGRGNAAQ
jgi:hypothetical protein